MAKANRFLFFSLSLSFLPSFPFSLFFFPNCYILKFSWGRGEKEREGEVFRVLHLILKGIEEKFGKVTLSSAIRRSEERET